MKTVLSIDGGGIRGLIPALVIAEIERRTGQRATQLFDFFAGTSTGGIIALALNVPDEHGQARYRADEIAELYRANGRRIFPKSLIRAIDSAAGWLDEKYSQKGLEDVLVRYFGESMPLQSALKPTMVSAYDLLNRKPAFLKSFHPDHRSVPMWLAARATSAAPTYFEPAEVAYDNGHTSLVDGGVYVNNPAMSAYAEAVRGWRQEDIFVVSIGTGSECDGFHFESARNWGRAQWLRPLMHIVFDGVSDAVDYQMTHILGDQYVRLQTVLRTARPTLDDTSAINIAQLEKEAQRLIETNQPAIADLCARLTHHQKEVA